MGSRETAGYEPGTYSPAARGWRGVLLNDIHSRLNPTHVAEILRPKSTLEVAALVRQAVTAGKKISIAGARHAMGGQQFREGSLHLDMTGMKRVLRFDVQRGLVRVEAGATWPDRSVALEALQVGNTEAWTYTQKQTGADHLTLGGAVSANIHGRGLAWRPFVQDVESLVLVNALGDILKVSRLEHPELFQLVVGGYGLFGVIAETELRLQGRQTVRRVVEIAHLKGIARRIEERVEAGFTMGDFQFNPDERALDFLGGGVFACYQPIANEVEIPSHQAALSSDSWRQLIVLAHSDKPRAWLAYTRHYQTTHGQIYGSDRVQRSHYDDDYEERLENALPNLPAGSLMITELYVPRDRLEDFMAACASDIRQNQANVIYGTIRFIKRDTETFLSWAREDFACIVVNLRVTHTAEGLAKAQAAFRQLIDRTLERGGSFYLTYHRWATGVQLLKAYPQFPEFLRRKLQYDPSELFQSDWYQHWKAVVPS